MVDDAAPAANKTGRKRAGGCLGSLALFVVAIGFALLLGELAVRLIRPQHLKKNPSLYVGTDTIGYERQPNLHVTVNTGEGPAEIITDSLGYRVGTAGRREGRLRVLLGGDSFMEALRLNHEETVTGLLEAALTDSLGETVVVRNTGVSGYTPSHYLLVARRALRRERFHATVIAVFVGNDIVRRRATKYKPRPLDMEPGMRMPARATMREFKNAIVFPVVEGLTRHSHLMTLLWNGSALLRMRLGLWNGGFPDVFLTTRAGGEEWDTTTAIMKDLATEAAAAGAPATFLIVPSAAQLNPAIMRTEAAALGIDSSRLDVDQANRLLTERFRAAGLDVIDALPALRRSRHAGRLVFGGEDRHLNAEGHKVLRDLVLPHVMFNLKREEGRR